MDLFLSREVDAAAAMTYNELAQVLETKNPKTGKLYKLSDLNVISMENSAKGAGTSMLEDEIFVRDDWIKDKKNQAIARKFLAASFKGWIYCRDHASDCVKIVLKNGPALPGGHQKWQMNEINALIWPNKLGIGVMDPKAFNRTAKIAKQFKVIKKAPSGAYRSDLAKAAVAQLKAQGVDVYGKKWKKAKVTLNEGGKVEIEAEGGDLQMSVLIKGGRIITAADDYVGDIYVEGERISLIGESLDVQAERVIDAAGKYVLPGLRRPAHASRHAVRGTTTIDDVESGQTAAAFGGTTCHVDFIIQPPGSTLRRRDRRVARQGERQAGDRHGLPHGASPTSAKAGRSRSSRRCPDQGITSYKLFMAYKGALMVDDETLFKTMEVAAETGALVMVHAENGDAIDVLVKKALAEGHTEPHWHALTRPPETEGEATNRAIQLARVAGAPLYVVHVSCKESVEPIQLAREKGWDVWGETCTQYFFVDYTLPRAAELRGREVRLHAAAAGQGEPGRSLERGPHATRCRRSRPTTAPSSGTGRRRSARTTSRRSRTAGPGLENRLQMIHGVRRRARGRISLNRMVELLCDESGEAVRPLSAQGARSPSAPTPTSSCSIRRRRSRSPRRHSTQ